MTGRFYSDYCSKGERDYSLNRAQCQLRQRWLRFLTENRQGTKGLWGNEKGGTKKRLEVTYKWKIRGESKWRITEYGLARWVGTMYNLQSGGIEFS